MLNLKRVTGWIVLVKVNPQPNKNKGDGIKLYVRLSLLRMTRIFRITRSIGSDSIDLDELLKLGSQRANDSYKSDGGIKL